MLRITPQLAGTVDVLKLEGSLIGPWVSEVAITWIDMATAQPGRRILVDLTEVHRVDQRGRELMALMYCAGVRFVAQGFVMPEIVREISERVDGGRRS